MAFVLVVTGSFCFAQKESSSAKRKTDPEVEALIDRLTDFGKPGNDAGPWSTNFVAIDRPRSYDNNHVARWSDGPVDPAMRKLVQLGVRSLPALIAHLDDDRETQTTRRVDDRWQGATVVNGMYDPRYRDPKKIPQAVRDLQANARLDPLPLTKPYTFRVGDVCLDAIGQIVNRALTSGCIGPFGRYTINSPVHNSALRAAVAADWGNLTTESQRKQLVEDYGTSSWGAMSHLLYYFPKFGNQFASKLLNREIVSYDLAEKLIAKLMGLSEPGNIRWTYDQEVRNLPPAVAVAIPGLIERERHAFKPFGPTAWPWFVNEQRSAERVMTTLFPNYLALPSYSSTATTLDEQSSLVTEISFQCDNDTRLEIQKLFRRLIADHYGADQALPESRLKFSKIDHIAFVCADAMRQRGFESEYIAFFQHRLSEVSKEGGYAAQDNFISQLQSWIQVMTSKPMQNPSYGGL